MDDYLDWFRGSLSLFSPTALLSALLLPPPPPPAVPFPHLPVELVFRILSYTLPPPSYTHAKDRVSQLKQFALFDSDFARWADFELRTHVVLSTLEAARTFLVTAERRGKDWAASVRSLRLGCADVSEPGRSREVEEKRQQGWKGQDSSEVIRDLLDVCENVTELWMCGIADVELIHLNAVRDLRKLYLHSCSLFSATRAAGTPIPLRLPHLHSLHLNSVTSLDSSLTLFLNSTSLPSLRILDCLEVSAPNTSISPYLPALTSLSLGPSWTHLLPARTIYREGLRTQFPHLHTLSVPSNFLARSQASPADYPSSLLALRISCFQVAGYQNFTAAVRQGVAVLQHGTVTQDRRNRRWLTVPHLSILPKATTTTPSSSSGATVGGENRIFRRSNLAKPSSPSGARTDRTAPKVCIYEERGGQDSHASGRDGVWELELERWRDAVEGWSRGERVR
ncbi:hypothetical protein JCM8097_000062 [Rhodosporidiobolus ruineniae]